MPTDLRPPGVLIERFTVDRPADPARIDIPMFVVVAERGPLHRPRRVGSWAEFLALFGGFVHGALGAYAAKAFFDNGGDACWIVRVAAPATSTGTVGAQPADRRASIVAGLDGIVVGAAATLTQGTLHRTHLVTAVDAVTMTVTWDRLLHPDLDLTLPIDVATGAAAAGGTVDGPSGPCLDVTAAAPGVWGNHLTLTVGPGRPMATTNRTDEPSDGTFTVVRSAVGFEPGTSVVVSQELAGIVTVAERIVSSWVSATGTLWWDTALPATIDPTQPLSVRSRTFTVTVAERGVVREVLPDLQAVAGGSRFVDDVTAESGYVRVVAATGEIPLTRSVRLGGGRDGVAALTVADFLGDDLVALVSGGAGGVLGLATTVDLDEPAAVAIPDLVAPSVPGIVWDRPPTETDPCWPCQPPPPPPPADDVEILEGRSGFDASTVVAAQRLLIEHCERHGERMAFLDPPGGDRPLGVTEVSTHAFQLPSDRAVLIAPWISVIDPAAGSVRAPKRLPASAHYAGLVAATDLDLGPWAAPANRPLAWAHGLGATYDDTQHALLNEAGVVVIRAVAALGSMPLGVRTLSADPLWLFVTVRRTMIWLRRTIRLALAWTAFEPADHTLVRAVTTTLDGLLHEVWVAGGLAGREPREAFFVQPAEPAGSPDGQFLCTIGVSLARPAEFVTVQVHRTANRLELVEVPEPGSWP